MLERFFFRRPRILNLFHRLHLADATTQTTKEERTALRRHAKGARNALEIGTYQGVSASDIAQALGTGGLLHCVDPWPDIGDKPNPCLRICLRHFQRSGIANRIRLVRCYSNDAGSQVPEQLDFAFIDGDHSRKGIETDWKLIAGKMRRGGVVCLHDSVVPPNEEWRRVDSCTYFEEVIRRDPRFSTVEIVHSMAVLQRV